MTFKDLVSRPGVLAAGQAAACFLERLPALVAALLCLRAAELAAGVQPGSTPAETMAFAAKAIGIDLFSMLRYLPALFLFTLPFLIGRQAWKSFWGLGTAWSLLVLAHAALVQYFLSARLPLGADLFAYSWHDITETVAGGGDVNIKAAAGLGCALAALWSALALLRRRKAALLRPQAAAWALAAALIVPVALPKWPVNSGTGAEDAFNLSLNKTAFFLDDSLPLLSPSWLRQPAVPAAPAAVTAPEAAAGAAPGFRYLDPAYPFLRAEQTPDALGPYFNVGKGGPPNLVFIVVEGLGRSFSGPGAGLGSFTPILDQLADSSLYWENFLAVQGRTFGVLPSLFGSLPFASKGFADLGARMPAHASLLSVLKAQGYSLRFYMGSDLHFDNQDLFLKRQGMDKLVGEDDFGRGYKVSNSWGYGDNELVSRTLEGELSEGKQPFVSVLQTITMHTPYTFLGQERYFSLFEKRLDLLGIPADKKGAYRANKNIYTSVMYTDEALGRFFEEYKKNPAYQNTIFILTGDHRLPEIPMWTRIDRYHVPLLIYSPLLKAPARIKSVSSHFDVAPSLLALLAANYGLKSPSTVTWLGSGLDLEPSFRNIHSLPLKQTRSNLVDFLSGELFINQDKLYKINDGLDLEPVNDAAALARVQAEFSAFKAANDQFARTLQLVPAGAEQQLEAYRAESRAKAEAPLPAAPAAAAAALAVGRVRVPDEAKADKLVIEAVFTNSGKTGSDMFVPLAVLMSKDARELSESYGPLEQLPPGGSVSLKLPIKAQGLSPGRYYLAVFPSDPATGKRIGTGRFHVPVNLR